MKTIYLDLGMGAAGDMLTAALLELLEDKDQEAFLKELAGIGSPDTEISREKMKKMGITGSHMHVKVLGQEEGDEDHDHDHDQDHYGHHGHDHHHDHGHHDHGHDHDHDHDHHDHDHHGHDHHHTGMGDLEKLVGSLAVSDRVRKDVMAVYDLIARAESRVHGESVEMIHFHEVGALDAVADITAVCMLMERLSPDRVAASPIHAGSGHVHCAHGILPVPAPATALLLEGIPWYSGSVKGELCTPTGAALVRYFADSFGDMPVMRVERIGYGMGKKEFSRLNAVRALLGETEDKTDNLTDSLKDQIIELSCNVDDMTGEETGAAMERLYEAGAREVFTTAVGMKKSRPGVMITVLTDKEHEEDMVRTLFAHTTTIGIRRSPVDRYVLDRREEILSTPSGSVRCKVSSGWGVTRRKYEYDDVAAMAKKEGKSIREVRDSLQRGQ